ncbi:FAD-dependent oxidoreductase [uncultured Algoriphagus sp.]|uniref:FAD-dependent oxidoreductase n=1 Tax=uncultured Algoriphagus sp. TaxID=417365 RepID=UPI0030EF1B2D|tara:strand:+ start:8418 stop:10079 length:1662 start_codon:yes stop_codon:yes gene_type:complete
MKKPILFLIDDDPAVLKSIQRDVRSEFRDNYRIVATQSAKEALEALIDFKKKGETVALFLSDQRMPEMLGVEFLEKAKAIFPDAKRILLTAYSDTEAAIRAINEVQLDYYLLKPWDPPEEKLYPVLNDQLDEWQSSYIPDGPGLKIVGHQWSPKSHLIKDFLSGNLVPYQWLNIENSPQGKEMIELNGIEIKNLPAVFFEDGSFLTNPTTAEVGEKAGMSIKAKQAMYDVAVIGAGPAGLAASVYGGSEGLNTLLIEKRAPGGQAGTSSRIENYLGFPKGLSGAELSRRAITQATRFGIEFLSPQEVVDIKVKDNYKIITLKNGEVVNAKTIIISTGVDYRKHPAKGIDEFTGAGIYYGAATTEAVSCQNEDIYIVGGGNSAGQAAMYLSKFAKMVYIVVRKPDLSSSMSHYLIDQISSTSNIEVVGESEITEVTGKDRLSEVVLLNTNTKKEEKKKAAALFIFIGARPITDWLQIDILKDKRGFLETGPALTRYENFHKNWKLKRDPLLLETCIPGIFAAGDVRSGAMNRVASAVGEGSMAIKFVHEYLASN